MSTQSNIPALFNNIPKNDYLKILGNNKPNEVVEYLGLSKDEVAKATKISKSSIRYDERMPEELKSRLREIAVTCGLVAEFFEGDIDKTTLWFNTSNPLLGNISPRDMICFGRYQKLVKFILNALNENYR